MTIQRGFGCQALQVVAKPVPLDNRAKLATGFGFIAMLVIHDPSEETYLRRDILSAMFSLTSSEARLLSALSRGQTLKQYGADSHVTQNTARTHLKSVFAKTKTSRQSDLIRLISGLTHSVSLYGIICISASWDFLIGSPTLCAVATCA
jgi:DNA-binding CsgD family transcriptional regulator